MALTPNLSTLLPPTFSPTLSAQTREGRQSMVAKASPMMGLERPYLGLGVERKKADVSLSLSF